MPGPPPGVPWSPCWHRHNRAAIKRPCMDRPIPPDDGGSSEHDDSEPDDLHGHSVGRSGRQGTAAVPALPAHRRPHVGHVPRGWRPARRSAPRAPAGGGRAAAVPARQRPQRLLRARRAVARPGPARPPHAARAARRPAARRRAARRRLVAVRFARPRRRAARAEGDDGDQRTVAARAERLRRDPSSDGREPGASLRTA